MERMKNRKLLKTALVFVLAIALMLGYVPVSTVPDVAQAETYVAVVQDDSTGQLVNKFTSLQDAIDYVINYEIEHGGDRPGTVILEADVALNTALNIGKPGNSANYYYFALDLNGHTIDRGLSDKAAEDNGYVIKVENINFQVVDSSDDKKGTITGGNNTGDGGGIYIKNDSSGQITATIEDVAIKGNKAQKGAGIYVDSGENQIFLNLNCSQSSDGKSSITDNHASGYGGGVYVRSNNTVSLINTDITSNSAGSDGGGIYADEGSEVYVYESPCVQENTKGTGTKSNVMASGISFSEFGYLDKKARIGVSIRGSENNKIFTNNKGISESRRADWIPANFTSDDPAYVIGYDQNKDAFLCAIGNAHTVTVVNGGTTKTEKVAHNSIMSEPEITNDQGGAFVGWYKGDTEFDFSLTRITEDCTITAKWNEGIATTYLDENGSEKSIKAVSLTGAETKLKPGWYVADKDITFTKEGEGSALELTGDVKLILADGVTVNVGAGITYDYHGSVASISISGVADLTVYGQKKGNGKLCPSGAISLCDISHGKISYFTLHGGEINVSNFIFCGGGVRITGGKLKGSYDGIRFSILHAYDDVIIDGGIVDLTCIGGDDYVFAVYSEFGDVIINGGDVTLTYIEDNDTEKTEKAAIFAQNVRINGGRVKAVAELRKAAPISDSGAYWAAIVANYNITIGYNDAEDSFMATCYFDDGSMLPGCLAGVYESYISGGVQIAEGQTMIDEEVPTKTYTGTLTAEQILAITGRTLVPVTYTVTFNSNGGSAVKSQKVFPNGKVKKTADPTRNDYTFEGWYENSSFTGAAFDFNMPITKNTTLYAKWKKKSSGGSSGGYSGGSSSGGSSGGTTPVTSPAPTASPAPAASAAPAPVASTAPDANAAPTIVDQKTETTTSPDGSKTTTTTTTTDSEGTVKTETVTTSTDGSVEKTSETVKADGTKETTSETVDTKGTTTKTAETVYTDGSSEKTSEINNSNGSSQVTTTKTEADGDYESKTVTTDTKGRTTTVTETKSTDDKTGKVTVTSETEKPSGATESSTVVSTAEGDLKKATVTETTANGKTSTVNLKTNKNGDVTVKDIKATKSTVTIPATVTDGDGKAHKVTTITAGILDGQKKVKTLVVSKNIDTFRKNALKGSAVQTIELEKVPTFEKNSLKTKGELTIIVHSEKDKKKVLKQLEKAGAPNAKVKVK